MPHSPFGAMRRKEREITDRAEIDEILAATPVMHLALSMENIPFLVPLFFAYDGAAIYFHSAQQGTKIEILKVNPEVCFEVSVDQGFIPSENACDFEARHRTVIGFGTATFLEAEEEKSRVLDRIVARFSDRHFDYPKSMLKNTLVVRIQIHSMRGKKHQ